MADPVEGVFFLTGKDFTGAGSASSRLKGMLENMGVQPDIIRRISIAAFEAEMNTIIYAVAGQQLHRQGRTILLVTHDEAVARHARRVLVLSNGMVAEDHPVAQPWDARVELAAMPEEVSR